MYFFLLGFCRGREGGYLYNVDLLKFRLRNLATCSSARHNIGIKATGNNEHNSELEKQSKLSIKNQEKEIDDANESDFTFEVKIWGEKCEAVNEVNKILADKYWLKPHLHRLQIPRSRFLKGMAS